MMTRKQSGNMETTNKFKLLDSKLVKHIFWSFSFVEKHYLLNYETKDDNNNKGSLLWNITLIHENARLHCAERDELFKQYKCKVLETIHPDLAPPISICPWRIKGIFGSTALRRQ